MTRRIARALVVLVVASGVVPAAYSQSHRGADRDITIRDAWVRASTARRTSSSGYCRIENATDKPVALVRISAPGVGTAQVHALEAHGTQMAMHPVARLTIPPHGAIDLAPGGRHIMLEEISRPLTIGDTLELQFTFEDGRTRTARAIVRPLDAMSIR